MKNAFYQKCCHYVKAIQDLSKGRSFVDVLFWGCYVRVYWKLLDALHSWRFPPHQKISCKICGHSDMRKNFETKRARCYFNGGLLERYICPGCGVIFGPLKMSRMSSARLGWEYKIHYKVFAEGDSTAQEMSSFFALNPTKGKKYLNYGAGCWSNTYAKLTELGYEVYNYEPFVADKTQAHIITDRQRLSELRFDGIFSCSLIEHLQDPIGELSFMYSLLKPEGKMAHGTGCYEYAYEYTRFHLFFFVGRSLDVLSNILGSRFHLSERIMPTESYRVCVFEKV